MLVNRSESPTTAAEIAQLQQEVHAKKRELEKRTKRGIHECVRTKITQEIRSISHRIAQLQSALMNDQIDAAVGLQVDRPAPTSLRQKRSGL